MQLGWGLQRMHITSKRTALHMDHSVLLKIDVEEVFVHTSKTESSSCRLTASSLLALVLSAFSLSKGLHTLKLLPAIFCIGTTQLLMQQLGSLIISWMANSNWDGNCDRLSDYNMLLLFCLLPECVPDPDRFCILLFQPLKCDDGEIYGNACEAGRVCATGFKPAPKGR